MAGFRKQAASLLFSVLVAALAFIAGAKREQIPEYLPTMLSTKYFPGMFKRHNMTLDQQYDEKGCPTIPYSSQIFSFDPLVIYIRGFIPPEEREYLKSLAQPNFKPSTVASDENVDTVLRSSSSALLPTDNTVVRCITKRASKFQGFIPLSHMEPLQIVRYLPGESYKFHNDWDLDDAPGHMRSTTFFAYVDCEGCVGGNTRFYHLSRNGTSKRWCDVIDCNENELKGVKFLPVDGNAVFWENLKDGVGIEEVLHAGTALEKGVKYGLNIWSRESAVD